MNAPRYSKPGAIPFGEAHNDALYAAKNAIQCAVEEFERRTGRTVDGIHMTHIDVTELQASEPQFVRDFHLSVLYTEAEEARAKEVNDAWRRHFAGEGPRPE